MIYIHIPFCRSFCTYCDFYSEVAAEALWKEYSKALCLEIRSRRTEITDEVNTLYIGGGTPSMLPLSVFSELLDTLGDCGHGGPYDEFTVEVNPDDIVGKGPAYVEGLLGLGVTRVSMGVQSFNDGILRWMNRRHDAASARKAYAILEEAGVPDISIDLIFGLPQLSDDMWQDTLSSALDISSRGNQPRHISSYQLSVEPGSALACMAEKGVWAEASQEQCARQYAVLCERLAEAGYHHYEISNFALPGHEAMHNSAYWRHVPYAGFGPGAHSFAGGRRQWNLSDLQAYLKAASVKDFSRITEYETLSSEQRVLEQIMLSLRTSSGIPYDTLKGQCPQASLSKAFSSGNLILLPSGNVRIPEDRFFVSDSIISGIV